ncbi:MAG: hypothetical protein ACQXXF_00340 [Thermoplasmatota archaeon]
MKKIILKPLVLGISLLFIALAFQPAMSKIEIKKEEVEPKQYLYETIIEIINNPDIKNLLNQVENKQKNNYNHYIACDLDGKEVVQKLLFKKPYLLYTILFTESKLTINHLDSSYNRGCQAINILGEKNVIKTIESVEIVNPEVFDNIQNFVINNEGLQDRIITLINLNKELDPNIPFRNYSIICKTLLILFYVYLIRCIITYYFSKFFEGKTMILVILNLLWFKNWELAGVYLLIFKMIYDTIGCEKPTPS